MKIDLVSIFPTYFDVLSLSLMGRAKDVGILDVSVHDLRDFTHDRHRTVDDTPYGGGAGMVMKPEPWGEAFDAILPEPGGATTPLVIFPSPAGALFDQRAAERLAGESHLVFACGRYEGIDQRVHDYAALNWRAEALSLGDYVLNGGEVAAIAMIEAVARLLPDVVGNPESLVEESHQDGLLEYPSYTKPASWRGLDVPDILRSGDHAAIAAWRREQQLQRTRAIRPDLLS